MRLLGSPPTQRDVYADLLRDTRGIRRDASMAREQWFGALAWDHKEGTLFELEMLFKGMVSFGNAHNHAGPPRRASAIAHDFAPDLLVLRDALDRTVVLLRTLLGEKDRAYTFARYLETVMVEDSARTQLVSAEVAQETPEESLFLLRNAFGGYLDLADALLRLGRVPNRMFYALHGAITREISRNAFFNPLVALEFRPEFDRIRHPQVLDALASIGSDGAHRVVALTFLALFRALRYLALVDECASSTDDTRRAHAVLAVLRSDLRALTRFLHERARHEIADELGRELLATPASAIVEFHGDLVRLSTALTSLRTALRAIGESLRTQLRKTFERDLPSPDTSVDPSELAPQLVVASASLRAVIHEAITTLCREILPHGAAPELALDTAARRATSERLRLEIWMFSQVLRAFIAKALASRGAQDLWLGQPSFAFVREFLVHFRAIGYQLVRSADYARMDPFLHALVELRDVDLLDLDRLDQAIDECRAFSTYLDDLFSRVSEREELKTIPFDKRAAIDTLKTYLGAS